jgi:integrase
MESRFSRPEMDISGHQSCEPEADELIAVPSGSVLAELRHVAERAREYAERARAQGTLAAYGRAWRAWEAWCVGHGLAPLPCDPGALAIYVTLLADRGLAVSTLAVVLAAITFEHERAGHPQPRLHPAVAQTWAGIRRTKGTAPRRKAAALSPEQLRKMIVGGQWSLGAVRDRALLLLGFAAALRRSELVAADVEHLTWDADGLVLFLPRTKVDRTGAGRSVGIPFGSDRVTCPVRAVRDWLDVSGITPGAIFRGVRKGGRLTEHRLTGRDVARIVQRAARQAGLDLDRLSGHSLRSGLVTTAAKAGKRPDVIAEQTGHRSIATLMSYIRGARLLDADNAAAGIGL